ncbi:MAG: hypothetical protein IPJ60_18335 [Sphingobacteriaceae bacterium]|nr:hypothetical protein [Sphingobacteriaceae bacterium]
MKELIEERAITRDHHHKHKTDWHLIIKALIPTLIIATGAGLTIPFISLFFEKCTTLAQENSLPVVL